VVGVAGDDRLECSRLVCDEITLCGTSLPHTVGVGVAAVDSRIVLTDMSRCSSQPIQKRNGTFVWVAAYHKVMQQKMVTSPR